MLNSKPLMFFLVMMGIVALFSVSTATADVGGPCPTLPSGIVNFDTFVNDETYFNPDPDDGTICEEVTSIDFADHFLIAGIATEAVNSLTVSYTLNSVNGQPPVFTIDTEDCSTFRIFYQFNFRKGKLVFKDGESYQFEIDPFCPNETASNCPVFKICRLTQNSKPINIYPNKPPLILEAGTFIAGFNDRGGDMDHDDLIVALTDKDPGVAPEQLSSLTPFIQTDPDSGKTCSITINEELLPLCADGEKNNTCKAITVTGDCTATKKLLTNLTFGKEKEEKGVIGLPLREWIGASGSPGQFTYCYPSGSCVVFTFLK